MKSGFTIQTMVGIALMCVWMTLTSWLTVPAVIPFTLQTLGVFLAVGLLGTKGGTLAVGLYLLLGAVGLPVFAAMKGGIGVLLGPTGGYLLGLLPAALACGLLLGDSFHPVKSTLSFGAGLLVSYAVGTLWYVGFYASHGGGLWGALTLCVFPFLVPDLLKILLATVLVQKVRPLLQKTGWKRW